MAHPVHNMGRAGRIGDEVFKSLYRFYSPTEIVIARLQICAILVFIFQVSFVDAAEGVKAIAIIGPGKPAFDSTDGQALKSALTSAFGPESVIVFGDGESPLDSHQIQIAIKRTEKSHPLIVVYAHGEMESGNFMVNLGQTIPFQQLFETTTQPVNLFLMACHGGGCLLPNQFPKNSQIVTTSNERQITSGTDVRDFVTHLREYPSEKSSKSSFDLLLSFLARGLKNRMAPQFMVFGKTYDTDKILKHRIGKPFTEVERERILLRMGRLLPESTLNTLMHKIGDSKSYGSMNALEYGPAIAITLAAVRSTADLPPTLNRDSSAAARFSSCSEELGKEWPSPQPVQ